MQLAQIIEGLRADLTAVAAIGDEQTAQTAERIGVALEGSLALRLVDAFSSAALELNAQIPNGHVEVRLAGRDPELVFVQEEQREEPQAPSEEGATARITLRLPDSLKDQVEAAAAAAGVSANTWLIRTLARAVSQPAARRSGNRLSGFAES